jgi:hypothetical protein
MAISANEKVLTLDYWKPASKIVQGDYLFDNTGRLVKVKLVQEYYSEDCYEVRLNDHLTVTGDQKLGFLLETKKYRERLLAYKGKFKFRRPLKHYAVQDLLETPLRNGLNRSLYSIPTAHPLQFPHQTLPIPPFLFGFWFFARQSTGKLAAPHDKEDYVREQFKEFGYKVRNHGILKTKNTTFSVTPTIHSQLIPNVPTKIPENYLLASKEQRIELLRGILHAKSRQYSPKYDEFRFTNGHYGTVLQIAGLVESLGSKSIIEYNKWKKDYTVIFKSRIPLVANQVSPPVKVHYGRRFVMEITKVQPRVCIHIETDGENNSILVGEGFIAVC